MNGKDIADKIRFYVASTKTKKKDIGIALGIGHDKTAQSQSYKYNRFLDKLESGIVDIPALQIVANKVDQPLSRFIKPGDPI